MGMSETTKTSAHWSFWLISSVALLWNVMGGMNFIMQMNTEMVATFPETHQAIIGTRPLWATAGFAFSVFGGAIGAVLLLLRMKIAQALFIASLLGTLVTTVHTARVGLTITSYSLAEWVVMAAMPVIVAAFLLWYARMAKTRGWIV